MRYNITDAKTGDKYCSTTQTSPMEAKCGREFEDVLIEGGDHTVTDCNRFTKTVGTIAALGTGR
jgi:hypothetical protein